MTSSTTKLPVPAAGAIAPAATPARKRGRPTASERALRRDEILDASVRLFLAGGFEKVTLDAVAAEARVTKRTIYAYFGDRTEMFMAAVARLRDRTLTTPAHDDDLLELAETIVFALHSEEAVGLHRLMISEAHHFPDLASRFYEDGPRAYISALQQRLPEPDPQRAERVFSLLLGEAHRRRLLALAPAPDRAEAAAHARSVLAEAGLADQNSE